MQGVLWMQAEIERQLYSCVLGNGWKDHQTLHVSLNALQVSKALPSSPSLST